MNAYSIVYSLSATILRRRIIGALQSTTTSEKANAAAGFINQNTVYAYPTVAQLTNYLVSLVVAPSKVTEGVESEVDQIENMISQYSNPWPKIDSDIQPGTTVLLTGSTGNLGSHILETLIRDPKILRIYAFNRPSSQSLLNRHVDRFEDTGFDKALLTSKKLTFVEGDPSEDNLGVSPTVYDEVCINACNWSKVEINERIPAPRVCRCHCALCLETQLHLIPFVV